MAAALDIIIGEQKQLVGARQALMAEAFQAAVQKAEEAWGLKYGGMFPSAGEFGVTTLRPRHVQRGTNSGTAEKWEFAFSTIGWATLFTNNVLQDVYLGIVGFAFPNTAKNVNLMQITAGGQTLPVLDVEEMKAFEEPIVLFKQPIVVQENQPIKLEASVENQGNQKVIPLGFALVKTAKLISQTPT